MISFQNDVRHALRSLVRSPGFVVAAVSSLGLAIGASVAAFSIIDTIRFRELPFPAASRLVLFGESPADAPDARLRRCDRACSVRYETWDNVIRAYPFRSLDAVAGFTSGAKSFSTGTDALLLTGGIMTPNAFTLLEARPILGRTFTADDNRLGVPLVVILSHGFWQSQFAGDSAIVGKVIKLSDSHYTVIGVMPAGFRFEVDSDFWLPVVPTLDPSTRPSIRSLQVIGRLREGQTLAQLRAELPVLDGSMQPGAGNEAPSVVTASGLRSRYATSAASRDLIFGALVACILLIACANLANLVLVRALRQRREQAVRVALGAGGAQLARPVLVQTTAIIVLATATGLALASATLGVLRSLPSLTVLLPAGMGYRIDIRVLAFTALVAILALMSISILPVRIAARSDVHDLLRSDGRAGDSAGLRVRQAFVIAQVACAAVLLTQAALIAETVLRMGRVNPGFDASRLLTVSPSFPHTWRVPETYLPVVTRLVNETSRMPGVEAVAVRSTTSLSERNNTPRLTIDGVSQPPSGTLPTVAFSISAGYFRTIGVPMLIGREFDDHDVEGGPRVAIVNRQAASDWWPGESPIGKVIRLAIGAEQVPVTIVGVARDNRGARGAQLLEENVPEAYVPYAQFHSPFPLFLVRTARDPLALIRPVRQLYTQVVPDRPLFTGVATAATERQVSSARTNALQIGAFALVGLLLAVIGVYGLLAFETARRTREIGIRSALGASRQDIVRNILFDTIRLSAIGVALGFPATVAVTGLIRGMLYPGASANSLVYLLVAVGATLVAVAASYGPARRAARIDPVIAMRTE